LMSWRHLLRSLLKTHHCRRRSNASMVLASPWFVPSLGEYHGITSLPFYPFTFQVESYHE
jgi:hypothetical protein